MLIPRASASSIQPPSCLSTIYLATDEAQSSRRHHTRNSAVRSRSRAASAWVVPRASTEASTRAVVPLSTMRGATKVGEGGRTMS